MGASRHSERTDPRSAETSRCTVQHVARRLHPRWSLPVIALFGYRALTWGDPQAAWIAGIATAVFGLGVLFGARRRSRDTIAAVSAAPRD